MTIPENKPRRATLVMVLAISSVGIAVMAIAALTWSTYYTHYPLWVEHAAFGMWANARFHDALLGNGYWHALQISWNESARHLLQPAVLGFVSARLLTWPHAHLLVSGATFALFLVLLALFVRRRTLSRCLTVALAVLFCSCSGLYHERFGLGAPWPDYQSMFLLSSAMLSFGLYGLSSEVRWLWLAGTCVSLAAFARDTAAIYAVLMCVPTLALLLFNNWRNGQRVSRVVTHGLCCGLPALPAVLLLVHKMSFLERYYGNAWQLHQGLAIAALDMWHLFLAFCGPLAIACISTLAIGALFVWPRRNWAMADVVVVYWPVSFFLFLLLNGYTSDVTKEIMYGVPGLVCAATLGGGMDMRRRPARVVVLAASVMCVVGVGKTAVEAYDRVRHPGPEAIALRQSQRTLAEALASIPRRVSWQTFSSYDWATVVSALTLYEFGRYQPSDNNLFFNRKEYWDSHFSAPDLPALQQLVLARMQRELDVAIVLARSDKMPKGMEEYSFSIASFVADHVKGDSGWRYYRDAETAVGPLSLYFNMRRMDPAVKP